MFIAYRLRRAISCLFLINNKLEDNTAEKFSLPSLKMFRAFLRSKIRAKWNRKHEKNPTNKQIKIK